MIEVPAKRKKKKLWGPLNALNKRWRPIRRKIAPYVAFMAWRLVAWTLRWRVEGWEAAGSQKGGAIFCGWHGQLFFSVEFLRKHKVHIMVSQSRDGTILNKLLHLLGLTTVRGSTGRGGERAAIEAIRMLRKGERFGLTPDGPMGPCRIAQPGVVLLAKKAGAVLVPMGASASRFWQLDSWDENRVPKPFAKVVLRFGDPIEVPSDADAPGIEDIRAKLERTMNRLSEPPPKRGSRPASAHAPVQEPMTLKRFWRGLRPSLFSRLACMIVRAICVTLRWRVSGLDKLEAVGGGTIMSLWHGRTLVPANYFRQRGIWAIFSHSNDGEFQARVFKMLGYQVIRGSTGRGGDRAAIEAIRVLRKGDKLAITPDGPRGPSHVVQGGVLLMAKKSGAAIVPIGASARPRLLIKTWDRYLIPAPFARARMILGDPIWLSKDADDQEMECVRQKLADAMSRLEAEAEADLGFKATASARSDTP